jgi:hypothetical protein
MPESDVAGAALVSPATGRCDGGGIGGSEGGLPEYAPDVGYSGVPGSGGGELSLEGEIELNYSRTAVDGSWTSAGR